MSLPSVYHHTGLETTGGATRVARLIIDELKKSGVDTALSFELAEKANGAAILPEDFGRYLPKDALPHLHCTGNWINLLGSLPPGRKVVITLHDCELFTGGCPYPLECPHLERECGGECPRQFPDCETLRKEKLKLLKRLNPTIVAPSRWLAHLAKKYLYAPVSIIPNGIPWPDRPTSKTAARRELGINLAARVVLFTAHGGMDAAYKSGNAWKKIWEAIKARMPEALCFAVGGDKAGRQGDLVIWPYVERDRLALLMAAADVLLYPTKADNHSLVVLEAMAQALPVVSYAVGGIPEQVIDGQTGVLIEPGDQAGLVEAALDLLAEPTRLKDIGHSAFSAGHKRFAAERMAADYVKLYRSMTENGG